jgi:hypothetical protein
VVGALVVSGVLVASFAPAASAARPVVIPGHTNPIQQLQHMSIGPAGNVTSTNWSGYAATSAGGTYSQVSSKWKEPSVKCTQTESIAVFWVGIDGYTSGSVEQDGSLAYCLQGVATYYTWWEMYPTNAVQIVGMTVQPGDKITSSVVRSGSSYTLKVIDATHSANSFTMNESCGSCANSSAEWIAERPSGGSGLYPLPDFGKISFSKDDATSNTASGSISQFPNDAITMINSSNQTLASVGNLKKQGKKFVDTWHQLQ